MSVRSTYRFARVPEWVLFHPALNDVAVRVYATLDRFDGKDCFPSLDAVAERVNKSADTVRRSIRALEDVGAIAVEARHDAEGRQTSNRYLLAGDRPLADLPPTSVADLPPTSLAETRGEPEQQEREQEEPTPLPPASGGIERDVTAVAFDAFWSLYPRKVGKPRAQRAFRAAVKHAPAVAIWAGARRWVDHWAVTRTAEQFIPHPATWLNDERWDAPCPKVTLDAPRDRARAALNRMIANSAEGGQRELG